MKSIFQRLISMLVAFTVITVFMAFPICAGNSEDIQVQPRWQHVNSVGLILDVEHNPVYLSVTVVGASGTTYSNGTIRLLRDGVQVAKWTGLSATTPYFLFSNEDITRYSGTYELQFSITATRNGVSETVSSSKTGKY